MSDMRAAIVPKSDQLNSDDLIAGPITITITGVSIKTGEQPIAISYAGDNGKPYKCCKSMARLLVHCWGPDSKVYVGRSLTLYRDPSVTWAGMAVGGIRVSHMSDIDSKITMALTATKQSRKPYTVQPITKKTAAPREPVDEVTASKVPNPVETPSDAAATNRDDFDPLLIKAQEWAEQGTKKYGDWFENTLTKAQRQHIGAERHEAFKYIAAKVTQ